MYNVSVKKDFIGHHFLIGGDWGPENRWHAHHYQVEVVLEGASLDQHGYLVDISDIEKSMTGLIERYRENTLNDLPEFTDLNPSIEHFSRIFCHAMAKKVELPNLTSLTVRIWEEANAWASYRHSYQCE
jgi:6-pyruvoyltetrahydropterin/6-carboxytetrahydropterin synthase